MGVRVYMETKKENKNLGSYPLCITVRDFNMELGITNENTVAGLCCYIFYQILVRVSTDYIHTVLDGVGRYIICLENKRCSCGQFQLDELPCPHALAALRHRDESFEQYCSPYYTRNNLLRTYEIPVNPLPDESKWSVPQHISEEVVNSPTKGKRQPGRPQKERYKTYDEINSKKYKVSCGNCGGEGHNKRSCKNAPKKK
ncbi:PREDICTED: uncharacterized protein LOC109219353 [Nicotiana attenuata]|uniref:uncharacterized protein LOC109219353 n=1 Tax=Nicotiana attenuata TaxID=49451 RepID=UPI000904EDB8|nr:PREDICTED: uncharacterized protein LOC109219353 [Nicotiana attenuata]